MFPLSLFRSYISRVNIQRPFYIAAVLNNNQQTAEQPRLETREITKDRTQAVPLETSLRYLKSEAYRQTYGGQPVWVLYRYVSLAEVVSFVHNFVLTGEIIKDRYHPGRQEKLASVADN